MISKFGTSLFLTAAICFLAAPFGSFGAVPAPSPANQKKIAKYTRQLKALPERSSPAAQVSQLVLKLAKLKPDKISQYYALGLRKSGQPGASGDAFGLQLSKELQKSVRKSGLSKLEQQSMDRRLNKIQRLYVPPAEPTPPITSASAMVSVWFPDFA